MYLYAVLTVVKFKEPKSSNMSKRTPASKKVSVSVKDPVGEAIDAIEDGCVELYVNMTGRGRTSPTIGAVQEYPQIEDQGLKRIAQKLSENTTVKVLDLSGNKIGGNGGLKALAKVLATNKTIEHLFLANNKFTTKDLGYLVDVLEQNETLTILSLQNCGIKDDGAGKLAEGLAKNKSLVILNLSLNSIRDDGAKALAKAFKLSQAPLARLVVNGNLIRAPGAKKLMKMLMENGNMETLDLSSNKINLKGAKYMDRLFDSRKELESGNILQIRLNNNRIHEDDMKKLRKDAMGARVELVDAKVELPKKLGATERLYSAMKPKVKRSYEKVFKNQDTYFKKETTA